MWTEYFVSFRICYVLAKYELAKHVVEKVGIS